MARSSQEDPSKIRLKRTYAATFHPHLCPKSQNFQRTNKSNLNMLHAINFSEAPASKICANTPRPNQFANQQDWFSRINRLFGKKSVKFSSVVNAHQVIVKSPKPVPVTTSLYVL